MRSWLNISSLEFAAGALLVGVLTGIFCERYRSRRRLAGRLEKLMHRQDKLLMEKEWLLREIHHRIKNNLQIIISLLHMQSVRMKDESAIGAFEDIGARVNTISLVHKKLYLESSDRVTIRMRDYVLDLVEYVRDSLCAHRFIAFHLDIADLSLDVSQVIPLGLILNEAITNAVKYAFPDNEASARTSGSFIPAEAHRPGPAAAPPTIRISLHEQPIGLNPPHPHQRTAGPATATLILRITDNGIGLPPGFDASRCGTLGIQLIQTLTAQLDGTFHLTSAPGVDLTITFTRHSNPLHEPAPLSGHHFAQ
ncbi:MAG TPA: sensor histidine kinase [Puia sp.]|uniref:sensor histidine kinase n=1 Tax=Puia sp. TaxID=2045100 RepID=UPI002C114F32|nr:sensor histidine kinase [Puia sp.]HVU95252.1 sensor histidine kinase [Puia sp.]